MQVPISEKIVAQIWHHQLISNPVTDSGVKLQVIYPGRPNNSNGCDFKDAVLIINGKIIRGDVEIHVKSSQWYKHSHHLNPKYNNTVLHVAMWNDNTSHVILQSGEAVPTVCLDKFLRAPSHTLRQQIEKASYITLFCPYLDKRRAINSTSSLLKTTGKKRFTIKATLFKEALRNNEDAGQILFRSITRALGYSQNMQPCENLANNLPLSLLEQVELNIHTAKQAWILGTAGLLPSQRHKLQNNIIIDGEIRKLENIWKASGLTAAIKEADWCFSKVRPDNFPTRRLVALSYILIPLCKIRAASWNTRPSKTYAPRGRKKLAGKRIYDHRVKLLGKSTRFRHSQ